MTPKRIQEMLEDVTELQAHSQSTIVMHSDDVLVLLRIAKAAQKLLDGFDPHRCTVRGRDAGALGSALVGEP